jgi:hypothetical protein
MNQPIGTLCIAIESAGVRYELRCLDASLYNKFYRIWIINGDWRGWYGRPSYDFENALRRMFKIINLDRRDLLQA